MTAGVLYDVRWRGGVSKIIVDSYGLSSAADDE